MANNNSDPADSIKIVVKDQQENNLYFKIKKDLPVKKVLLEYCRRRGLTYRDVNFLLNGARFQPHLTATQLAMETGDEFEVMLPMLGGASC